MDTNDDDLLSSMKFTGEEDDLKVIRNAIKVLMEHFDTVQIFTTRLQKDGEGTVNCNLGKGNWFARYGQVRLWLIAESNVDFLKKDSQ